MRMESRRKGLGRLHDLCLASVTSHAEELEQPAQSNAVLAPLEARGARCEQQQEQSWRISIRLNRGDEEREVGKKP